jgi:hypothetical protein
VKAKILIVEDEKNLGETLKEISFLNYYGAIGPTVKRYVDFKELMPSIVLMDIGLLMARTKLGKNLENKRILSFCSYQLKTILTRVEGLR